MKPYKEIKPFKSRSKPHFILPSGEKVNGILLDEVEIEDVGVIGNAKNKIVKRLVQKIRLDNGKEIFRSCYYYIDLNEEKPRWVFGQYALMFTKEQYLEFDKKMKEKGWI